jgi:hypothetical protein
MSINLSKVRAQLNNVKRKLYYGDTASLKLINVNTIVLELKDNWFLSPSVTSNLAIGAEYWDLYISDISNDLELDKLLKLSTAVDIQGERYKISQYTRPRGLTRQWNIRLESTGEKGT